MNRNRPAFGLFACVLVGLSLLAAPRAQGQGSVAAITTYPPLTTASQNFTGTRGSRFAYLGSSSGIIITELGVFDVGGDGLVNAHEIGLWSPDGTVLASATVPAGSLAPLMAGYRYVPINPVVILYGSGAIVAAAYAADDADDFQRPLSGGYGNGLHSGAPAGGYGMGYYGLGSGLPFPNLQTPYPSDGQYWAGFLEANFRFNVPEPSSASEEHPETAGEGLHWAKREWDVRQDALTMDTLAWAHSCNGNHTEGLKLSEHALLSGARTPAILLHAGLIRYRAGQTESGRGLLERALACPLAFGPSDRGLARIARPLLTSVQQN